MSTEGPDAVATSALEMLVRAASRDPAQVGMLCSALVRSELIIFGNVQDRGERTGTAQLDILHYLSGRDQVMPVFTEQRYVELAVREDPTTARLQAITVRGLDLLEHITDPVVILVNAWSEVETEVTPAQLHTAAAALRRASSGPFGQEQPNRPPG